MFVGSPVYLNRQPAINVGSVYQSDTNSTLWAFQHKISNVCDIAVVILTGIV